MHQTAAAAIAPPAIPFGPDKTLTSFFENYVQFRGFATREQFWWPFAFLVLVHSAIAMTGFIILGTVFSDDVLAGTYHPFGTLVPSATFWVEGVGAVFVFAVATLLLIIAAVTLLPLLAVTWRRLHDTGVPGSMSFLGFIPILGWLVVLILLARHSAPEKHHPGWAERDS